ncbi:FKBP-type peptidyl-prolyl cis-trans isomerase [Pedobacter sp. NJ-S-72]
MLYIPSELAYESHTNQGTILPNSTLIFEIEILQILP